MRAIVAKTSAKVNLLLNITGRRSDGYHELDGVMIPISLYDTVRVEKSAGVTAVCDRCRVPLRENTAYKAAALFFSATGVNGGADIYIRKRIPEEAGLGGGSSDAACVLNALNLLYETRLKPEELIDLAATLGADVPFFLMPGAKRARGAGELLDPVDFNLRAAFVILKPGGGVNTALAYKLFHSTEPEKADVKACIRALNKDDLRLFSQNAKNMLQDASCTILPEIKNAVAALYKEGAAFALMTGSGSAAYGLFEDMSKAKEASVNLTGVGFEFACAAGYTRETFEPVLRID